MINNVPRNSENSNKILKDPKKGNMLSTPRSEGWKVKHIQPETDRQTNRNMSQNTELRVLGRCASSQQDRSLLLLEQELNREAAACYRHFLFGPSANKLNVNFVPVEMAPPGC